jgi:signal transduction histidine kinase
MRERAEQVGGRLSVISKRGSGTTITLSAPIRRHSDEAIDEVA